MNKNKKKKTKKVYLPATFYYNLIFLTPVLYTHDTVVRNRCNRDINVYVSGGYYDLQTRILFYCQPATMK